MRLFRREESDAARRERVEQVERAVVDGFRALADVLRRAADVLERRRLSRHGYPEQERYLERVRRKDAP